MRTFFMHSAHVHQRRLRTVARRGLHIFAVACCLVGGVNTVQAQASYPNHAIHMIVPLSAGSAVDSAARILAAAMAKDLGQAIVIENLPGASGVIGADRVSKAAPDGYTIGGFNDSIMTMVPKLQAHLPWDIEKDFAPVSLVATVEWGVVVAANASEHTAADLIAAARQAPGQIDYGSGGIGSPQHIAMALFDAQAGIKMTHVPYKGATQAAVGVAGNEVHTAFEGIATVSPLLKSGKLRLLGVSTPQRMAQYPQVPTIAESGLPGFAFNSWFAVMVPTGTPPAVVKVLHNAIIKALANPATREALLAQGLTPRGTSAAELGDLTRSQLVRYGSLIEQNHISTN